MSGFTTVPFKTESAHGLTSVNGVAKFSSAGVVFEFESKLFGLISHGVKEVRLPSAEILDVKFKKGVFKRGAKIVIRTKTVAKLSELPNSEGKMTLKIEMDDFERASHAVDDLQTELKGDDRQLPPAHTPVSVLFDESDDETQRLNSL